MGSIKIELSNQFWISDIPPDLASVNDTQVGIKAHMKKEPILLELVVLIK
jgi:hypothetical protein